MEGGISSTTQYIWGNNGLAAIITGDTTVVPIYDSDGEAVGFFVEKTEEYTPAIPDVVTQKVYTYVKNLQGDVIRILDENGSTVVSYTYDPWGVPTVTGDADLAALNPCSYRGYDYDEDTGYYYLQSRYYDPTLGRFITIDNTALLAVAESPLEYNLFAYCANNYINLSDPTGYSPANVIGAIIGAVIGAVGGYLISRIIADKLGLTGWKRSVFVAGLTAVITATAAVIGYFIGPYIKNLASSKLAALKRSLLQSACFVEGTLVLTDTGYVPIEDINPGDTVYSTNPQTGESGYKTVERLFIHKTNCLVTIEIDGKQIKTTPTHPFWVVGTGWIEAASLSCGDVFLSADGEEVVVDAVIHQELSNAFAHTLSSFIVDAYVTILIKEFSRVLLHFCNTHKIKNAEDFKNVYLSLDLEKVRTMMKLTDAKIYQVDDVLGQSLKYGILDSYEVQRMDGKGAYIIRKLLRAYVTNPQQLPNDFINRFIKVEIIRLLDNTSLERLLDVVQQKVVALPRNISIWKDYECREALRIITEDEDWGEKTYPVLLRVIFDYISSMTDASATKQRVDLY